MTRGNLCDTERFISEWALGSAYRFGTDSGTERQTSRVLEARKTTILVQVRGNIQAVFSVPV